MDAHGPFRNDDGSGEPDDERSLVMGAGSARLKTATCIAPSQALFSMRRHLVGPMLSHFVVGAFVFFVLGVSPP